MTLFYIIYSLSVKPGEFYHVSLSVDFSSFCFPVIVSLKIFLSPALDNESNAGFLLLLIRASIILGFLNLLVFSMFVACDNIFFKHLSVSFYSKSVFSESCSEYYSE